MKCLEKQGSRRSLCVVQIHLDVYVMPYSQLESHSFWLHQRDTVEYVWLCLKMCCCVCSSPLWILHVCVCTLVMSCEWSSWWVKVSSVRVCVCWCWAWALNMHCELKKCLCATQRCTGCTVWVWEHVCAKVHANFCMPVFIRQLRNALCQWCFIVQIYAVYFLVFCIMRHKDTMSSACLSTTLAPKSDAPMQPNCNYSFEGEENVWMNYALRPHLFWMNEAQCLVTKNWVIGKWLLVYDSLALLKLERDFGIFSAEYFCRNKSLYYSAEEYFKVVQVLNPNSKHILMCRDADKDSNIRAVWWEHF